MKTYTLYFTLDQYLAIFFVENTINLLKMTTKMNSWHLLISSFLIRKYMDELKICILNKVPHQIVQNLNKRRPRISAAPKISDFK